MEDVIVIGGGAAGSVAAIRAADLDAKTVLVTSGAFEGACATDGPIPARTLAHAARSLRTVRQLESSGIAPGSHVLHHERLFLRARDALEKTRRASTVRERLDRLSVRIHEHCGNVHFVDAHTIACDDGQRFSAKKFIVCTGTTARTLAVPGIELARSYRDVWRLPALPRSMVVIGGGSNGVQVASVYNAFGTRVRLFESGRRILAREDESVSTAVSAILRGLGVDVLERFGAIVALEKTSRGTRVRYRGEHGDCTADADAVVLALGSVPATARLGLAGIGVALTPEGAIRVDDRLRTTVPHVFAAGDVRYGSSTIPGALEDGFVAATNAVRGPVERCRPRCNPLGSFAYPEYARVGATEAEARRSHDVIVDVARFDSVVRPIIEDRTSGFCKLIVDRPTGCILGCHVVGENAMDIAQLAAVAMTAKMRVDELARVAVSFPTDAEMLVRAAARVALELDLTPALDSARGPR